VSTTPFQSTLQLKHDLLGTVERGQFTRPDGQTFDAVRRDVRACPWWTRPLASLLLRREARVLSTLDGFPGVPRILHRGPSYLVRSWIPGRPLQEAAAAGPPPGPEYFRAARLLLSRLHRQGVTHNDTAKEPNWVVRPDGSPALIDFQLGYVSRRRTALFRTLGREDLRHLLKHKRTYCRDTLRAREIALLASPSRPSRALRLFAKPLYNLITRRLLHWQDREGRGR
jgi:predicted Ser/Thr protein kinase